MRGIFFSMDAVMGLALLVTVMSSFVVIMEMAPSAPERMLLLSRAGRDAIEVSRASGNAFAVSLPDGYTYGDNCANAKDMASIPYIRYDAVNNKAISDNPQKVCFA